MWTVLTGLSSTADQSERIGVQKGLSVMIGITVICQTALPINLMVTGNNVIIIIKKEICQMHDTLCLIIIFHDRVNRKAWCQNTKRTHRKRRWTPLACRCPGWTGILWICLTDGGDSDNTELMFKGPVHEKSEEEHCCYLLLGVGEKE